MIYREIDRLANEYDIDQEAAVVRLQAFQDEDTSWLPEGAGGIPDRKKRSLTTLINWLRKRPRAAPEEGE